MASPIKRLPRDVLRAVDVAEGVTYEDPPCVVEGVVAGSSQGSWAGREPGYEVHCFEFANWRPVGGPLASRKLVLLLPLPKGPPGEPAVTGWGRYPAYSIQSFSVLLEKGRSRAVIDEVLEADPTDEELRACAERLQLPAIVPTHLFGVMKQNPAVDWFEAVISWNQQQIRLSLDPAEDGSITVALKTAEALWTDQVAWKRRVEDCAVQSLLDDVWGDEDVDWTEDSEPPVSAEEFRRRLTLNSIHIESDGKFVFWHDDGDLFWGHSITVKGTLQDGPTGAYVEG